MATLLGLLLRLLGLFLRLEGSLPLANFVGIDETVGNWERDALEPVPQGLESSQGLEFSQPLVRDAAAPVTIEHGPAVDDCR